MTGSIRRTDLKIFKPELQGNSDQAGGQRSSNEVLNGALNQIFSSITVIDHAQGAVEVEKIFPAIDTPGTERLKDAHIYLSSKPLDPYVSVFIVESALINDNSRRPEMIEAIESGAVAGNLLRKGLSSVVQFQDLLPLSDFYQTETQGSVLLLPGDMVVIAVEYPGAENPTWPRKQHFAKILSKTANGYLFAPAMSFNAPSSGVVINGESGCTVLRAMANRNDTVFHGVSELSVNADAGSKTLKIPSLFANILPANESGNEFVAAPVDNISAALGVWRKVLTAGNGSTTFQFNMTDFFMAGARGVNNSVIVRYYSGGKAFLETFAVDGTSGRISVNLSKVKDPGTEVLLSYIATDRTKLWTSSAEKPVGDLLFNTVSGTVTGPGGTVKLADIDGTLYWFNTGEALTGAESRKVGQINKAGVITYQPGFSAALFTALVQNGHATQARFAVPVADYVADTFYVSAQKVDGSGWISASSNSAGDILGAGCSGTISSGYVSLTFTSTIDLSSIRFDVTEKRTDSAPVGLYPLNPLRLPGAGRVAMFRPWGVVVVSDRQAQAVPSPTNGQVIDVRPNSWVEITDSNGKSLWTQNDANYSYNATTGKVTLNGSFTGFVPPFVVANTLSEEAMIAGADTDKLTLSAPLRRAYPAGSIVSSVHVLGDFTSRVSPVVDLSAWSGNWDVVDAAPANATLNTVDYPIAVTNRGAVNEDWLLLMTSSTAFRCIGRTIGQIALGDTIADFAPINPRTGQPFFVIKKEAWGTGWQPGEAVRFETYAASKPTMLLRCVSPGHSMIERDSITLMLRGNED